VKRGVLGNGRTPCLQLLPLHVEDVVQLGQICVGDARGGDTGDRGLEHAAHVHQLVLQIVAIAEDGRQRRDEALDVEFARERPLPVPRYQQADRFQRAERVADRSAADAELLGERALGGERLVGRERAVEDQDADPLCNFLRNSGLLDWRNEAGRGATERALGGCRPLDTPPGRCQTSRSNWFDHRASVSRGTGAGWGSDGGQTPVTTRLNPLSRRITGV
jgi:hypothetical protein